MLKKDSATMKTPRARKRRSRVTRVVCGFAILLIGVGVTSTALRLWNNAHLTKTDKVHKNEAAIEQQVLDNVDTSDLRDLSGEKPVSIEQSVFLVGKKPADDSIKQGNDTTVTILDTGYVSGSAYKKLLTKKQSASNVMYIKVSIKNTGKKTIAAVNACPLMTFGANEVVKNDAKYPDGKVIYGGFSATGNVFVGNKVLTSDAKKIGAGKELTAVYLFDVTGHKNDKQTKQLSVYVNQNDQKVLTHQYTMKE